jgi:hypothetical protein
MPAQRCGTTAWPREQRDIFTRLEALSVQISGHQTNNTLLAITEILFPSNLYSPADAIPSAHRARFRIARYATSFLLECLGATAEQRETETKSGSPGRIPSLCVICQLSGHVIWRIPEELRAQASDCIISTWYFLP